MSQFNVGDSIYFTEPNRNAPYFAGPLFNLEITRVSNDGSYGVNDYLGTNNWHVHEDELAPMPFKPDDIVTHARVSDTDFQVVEPHSLGFDQDNIPSLYYIVESIATGSKRTYNANLLSLKNTTQHPQPEPPTFYGPTQTRTVNVRDYIKDQIKARYTWLDRPRNGKLNQVIDSYIPKLLHSHNLTGLSIDNTPSTATTISPFFAAMLERDPVHISDLIKILGHAPEDIQSLLESVQSKNLDITFVGFGGTGTNTTHWLTELCKLSNITSLFDNLTIFEEETVEYSNLLRFPINPLAMEVSGTDSSSVRKLDLFTDEHHTHLARSVNKVHEYLTEAHTSNDTIYYGAPDISTRTLLSNHKFIAGTHSGNSCNLYLNPTQDSDLQVESYGVIELTPFFLNQLEMVIQFLGVLASDLDLTAKDQNLFTYSFAERSNLRLSRNYNISISGGPNNA